MPRSVLLNQRKPACVSKAFPFNQFRTLLRNEALPTPLPSIASALFPMQRRGVRVSHFPFSLFHFRPSSDSLDEWSYHQTGILPRLKSFICCSYENCRRGWTFFPFWNCFCSGDLRRQFFLWNAAPRKADPCLRQAGLTPVRVKVWARLPRASARPGSG